MALDAKTRDALLGVSTATVTTVLLKKGLRNVWMRRTRPLRADQPCLVGAAFTMRFVPAREDLATPESWSSPRSTRAAIEAMPAGCIAVVDAMGVTDSGIFGDILCGRMQHRGVTALVTDGAVRDLAGVLGTNLPVWCAGASAPPSVAALTFVNWQEPIGCGGVALDPHFLDALQGDRLGAQTVTLDKLARGFGGVVLLKMHSPLLGTSRLQDMRRAEGRCQSQPRDPLQFRVRDVIVTGHAPLHSVPGSRRSPGKGRAGWRLCRPLA